MSIRRSAQPSRFDAALSVRRAALIDERGIPEDRKIGRKDDEAAHFLAYDDGKPIGVSWLRDDGSGAMDTDTAKVERVAVLEERRG